MNFFSRLNYRSWVSTRSQTQILFDQHFATLTSGECALDDPSPGFVLLSPINVEGPYYDQCVSCEAESGFVSIPLNPSAGGYLGDTDIYGCQKCLNVTSAWLQSTTVQCAQQCRQISVALSEIVSAFATDEFGKGELLYKDNCTSVDDVNGVEDTFERRIETTTLRRGVLDRSTSAFNFND